jgi:hypothetical protein
MSQVGIGEWQLRLSRFATGEQEIAGPFRAPYYWAVTIWESPEQQEAQVAIFAEDVEGLIDLDGYVLRQVLRAINRVGGV